MTTYEGHRHEAKSEAGSYKEEQNELETFFIKEDRAKGTITFKFIMQTLCAMGGSLSVVVVVFTTLVAIMGYVQMLSTFAIWGELYFEDKDVMKAKEMIPTNIIWTMVAVSFAFFRTGNFFLGGVSLGRKLHSKMTFKILHAKINDFLKRTPIGRILNRFSYDTVNADFQLSVGFDRFTLVGTVVFATAAIIVLGAENFLMLIPLVLFSVLSFYARRRLMNASRELYRLEAITKSPILSVSTACILGGPAVRSFNKEEYFEHRFERDLNENLKNSIMIQGTMGWFNSIIFQLSFFLILIPCYTIFLLDLRSNYDPDGEDEVNKQYLFLNNVIGFSGQFGVTLLVLSAIENSLISVERCRAYEKIPSEEGYLTLDEDAKNFEPPKKNALDLLKEDINKEPSLIQNGNVELTNVTAKYPTANDPIINDLSLKINEGEKVGIVGRTGAGKSSFIKLFWRALEPMKGTVKIGGKLISSLDLKKYRREINIITQDSNLFEGTLLSNITHKKISNQKLAMITSELRRLGFSESKLEKKNLGFHVTVGGDNLSQSEKQIVCLLRALMQADSKIVIMDEATAYIDERIEREFQNIVWDAFEKSTVFIIAHRISNVMKCDRILVFDKGRLIENGNPQELLENKKSVFYELWSQS